MLLAKDIRDRERGGRTDILLVDGDQKGSAPLGMEQMEGVLGKRSSELKDGAPDEKADQEQMSKLALYKYTTTSPYMLQAVQIRWFFRVGVLLYSYVYILTYMFVVISGFLMMAVA